jgi:hypothetical protein
MGKNWVTILTAHAAAWNIPGTVLPGLQTLVTSAETALATAQNEDTRTPVATAQCREAFSRLEDHMRDIKKGISMYRPLPMLTLSASASSPGTPPTP